MDIQKYVEKKERNLVEILNVGSAHALVSKRFDPETGIEIDAEIITLNKEDLTKQREDLINKLASLDALLADIKQPHMNERPAAN